MNTPLSTVNQLKQASDDDRRTIWEFNASDYATQFFHIKGGMPVGKHFHRDKTERFVFTKGGGKYRWYPVDPTGAKIGPIRKEQISAPAEVFVEAFVAHIFELEDGTEMVCFSSAPFDQGDLNPVDPF